MLDQNNVSKKQIDMIKMHLNITWSDSDTDEKLIEAMCDAEYALNHLLGAEVDYFSPGQYRQLYKNYMSYAWNECLDEFEGAYLKEINRLRNKIEVEMRLHEKEDSCV